MSGAFKNAETREDNDSFKYYVTAFWVGRKQILKRFLCSVLNNCLMAEVINVEISHFQRLNILMNS